jgi:hypothetical protein
VSFNGTGPEEGWEQRYLTSLHYFTAWRMEGKNLWYLTRHGQLAGYDGLTRRSLGTLAPDGQRFDWRNLSREDGFYPAYHYTLLAAGSSLYSVDLADRSVKPVFTTTNRDGIGGFREDFNARKILVVTRDAIAMLDAAGRAEWQIPYEPAYDLYDVFTVFDLAETNHYAVELMPNYQLNRHRSLQIKWVSQEAGVTRSLERVPELPGPEYGPENKLDQLVNNATSLVIPPVMRLPIGRSGNPDSVPDVWDVLDLVLAGVCAAIGWVVGRRYAFTRWEQAAWAGFHLLFGLPGLVAFFSVQEWPARERCPQCQKLRRVDREQCEHCGGGFAPPARNGTEIFEPAAGRNAAR